MKNKSTTKFFSFPLIFSLFFILGCKKQNLSTESEPSKNFSTANEAKAYVNTKLLAYSKIISKLSRNPEIIKLVNQKVAQKFDGDYNVLLKDLVSKQNALLPINLETNTKFTSNGKISFASTGNVQQLELDLRVLEEAISDPIVVNGQTLYPQIYIPYFEEQVMAIEEVSDETDACPGYASNAYVTPVIVYSNGEELANVNTYYGSAYDQNGILVENIPVDECFSKSNTVWAITLNERVDQYGAIENVTNTSSTSSTSSTNLLIIHIPKLTIKENKESWIKGANEVYIQSSYSWTDGKNPTTGSTEFTLYKFLASNPLYSQRDADAGLLSVRWESAVYIRDFTRKEIRNKTSIDVNRDYVRNSSSYYPSKGTHIYIAVYEQDGILSWIFGGGREAVINGLNTNIKFVSNDDPYLVAVMEIVPKGTNKQTHTTNFTYIDNDQISFTSQYK